MSTLEPLPPVAVDAIELVTVRLPLAVPLRSAASHRTERSVLLVHVVAAEAEGWAECVAEIEPTYAPEYVDGARHVLRHHLLPRAWGAGTGDAIALGSTLEAVRGHAMAKAALELAVLDAQLRAVDQSLARWMGATTSSVAPGASLGLHIDTNDLLAEADIALAAGAVRLRVKIAPGLAASHVLALRQHVGAAMPLQADANGTFGSASGEHLAELGRLEDADLTCIEQPFAPDDLVGHARLAVRLRTPICLDESITSMATLETAVALGACGILCLKPARVGGWVAARAIHDRCVELGLPMWVGGMLETGIGRAANLAVAALPGAGLPPDLDPRGRFRPDLSDPCLPGPDGLVAVPSGPGIDAVPDPAFVAHADVVRSEAP